MALEMAKLSLWLTTMAKERPFTFLDHQVQCGDSLLGITSLDQVRWVHVDIERGKELWDKRPLFDPTEAIDTRVTAALEKARALASIDVVSLDDVGKKARLHAEALAALAPLRVVADAVVGAALAAAGGEGNVEDDGEDDHRPPWLRGKGRNAWQQRTDNLIESMVERIEQSLDEDKSTDERDHVLAEIEDQARYWLDTGRPDLALDRRCLHWPLAFPEVFSRPREGFDGIVGNPPYLGGTRISGSFGKDYRQFIAASIAGQETDRADLIAFFFLRAFGLVRTDGCIGLLAKNVIAQGDTRDVGLGQILRRGGRIFRAISSTPWPGTSAVHVSKVWITRGNWAGLSNLDGREVSSISSFLTGTIDTRVAYQLAAARTIATEGVRVIGMGFLLTRAEAEPLVKLPDRHQVVQPYLGAEDLTSSADQSPTRWALNFHDWPLVRDQRGSWQDASEADRVAWRRSGQVPADYPGCVASDFPECLALAEERVRPERQRRRADGRYELRAPMPQRWWIYGDPRTAFYEAIRGLPRVLVTPRVSAFHVFAFANPSWVISTRLIIFALHAWEAFSLLQSSLHEAWSQRPGATKHETRGTYFVDNSIRTFPFSQSTIDTQSEDSVAAIGRAYYEARFALMNTRGVGLTNLYNSFHDAADKSREMDSLRELHVAMDHAVVASYGWGDLGLEHSFRETSHGTRFTISQTARQDIVDRLMDLNHQRYAEEIAQGLHEKAPSKRKGAAVRQKGKRKASGSPLFEEA
jgi:hypothetical protein